MPTTNSDTKVVTGKVRLSYCHLFEPYTSDPDNPPKYSCAILIPKSDRVTLAKIEKAFAAAAEAGKEKVFGGRVPKVVKNTLKDGDDEDVLEKNPEYAGHYFMNVSSKTKPGLVDRALNDIIDPSELYSGCYARVSINAFAYSAKGNKGVSFGLNHVQKLADGDYLGGRTRASDDFDELEDEEDGDGVL